jgi:hypothetical protein
MQTESINCTDTSPILGSVPHRSLDCRFRRMRERQIAGTVDSETGSGRLFLGGDTSLARRVNRWLRRLMYATLDGVVQLPSEPVALERH